MIKKYTLDETSVVKEFLTIKEACIITKFSRWTIARMLRMTDANGNFLIRWYKYGNANSSSVRIDKESFDAYFESKKQRAKDGKEVEK